jgi:osmotically-inducible protein OsmY
MPGHGASSSEEDVELTQDIREKVAKDGSLSAMAHNISITSSNGFVTLRGPVTSESERQQVAALAERVAGSGKVNNQLEIAR